MVKAHIEGGSVVVSVTVFTFCNVSDTRVPQHSRYRLHKSCYKVITDGMCAVFEWLHLQKWDSREYLDGLRSISWRTIYF